MNRSINKVLLAGAGTLDLCAIAVLWAMLSGLLRAASGIHLLLAGIISAAIFAAWFRFRTRLGFTALPATELSAALGVFAVMVLAFFICMYHLPFHGLVSVGGGDAGNHVYYKNLFVRSDPGIYQGFSAFFAMIFWGQLLPGLDDFAAFRFVFYLIGAMLCGITALFVPAMNDLSRRRPWQAAGLFLCLAYLPGKYLIFPLLHYLQADGFYPQLAGLLPLFLGWAAYVHLERPLHRVAAVAVTAVFMRYAYGLNLGDFALAGAVLISFEVPLVEKRYKLPLIFAEVICLAAGAYCLLRLTPILAMVGATLQTDLNLTIFGLAALSIALAVHEIYGLPEEKPYADRKRRFFLFAGVFSMISALALGMFRFMGFESSYYLCKYGHYAVLVASVSGIFLAYAMTMKVVSRAWTDWKTQLISLALMAAGFWMLKSAYFPMRPSFVERTRGEAKNEIIEPLIDRKAYSAIDKVLTSGWKIFGGYITPSWPESNFVNSSFGYWGQLHLYREGKLREVQGAEGRCYFWQAAPDDLKMYKTIEKGEVAKVVEKLEGNSGVERMKYVSKETGKEKTLAYVCEGGG